MRLRTMAVWLGLATLLPLVGCAGTTAGTATSENSVIVIADADPDTLNPGLTTSTQTLDVQSKIFEGLIWLGKDGQPQPQLATSWEISPDQLTYNFTLREGVKWHDGRPFTSADVQYSFQTLLKDNARSATVLNRIGQIEAPDERTIRITLKAPYAPFLKQMKVFDTPILPKHVYENTDIKTNPANRNPVGTGPFKFANWKVGQTITLVANREYWATDQPKLDEVVFKIIAEPQNRINAMATGEVDVLPAIYLPQANIAELEGERDVEVHKQTSIPALYFVQMNEANPALAKPEVRRALTQAIDRPRIVAQAMGGLATPGYGSFGNGFPWMVNPDSSYDKLYPLDPDRARAEIAAAGGVPELRLTYDSARPPFQAAAQIIKDNLARVGVQVRLEPAESSVNRDRVYAKRDFDLALQSFTSSGDPAIGYHRMYVTNPGRSANVNATGYSNPRVDELLTQATRVSDQAQRAAAYQQAQAMLDRDVPTLVLFDEQQADVNLTRVGGLYAGQNPSDQFGQVYVRQGS